MAANPLRTRLALLTIGVLSAATLAAGLGAQKPAPPPLDPQLPKKLKELKSMVADRKMRRDFQAIGLIQELTKAPEKLNPKDKSRLARALGGVFKTGKTRPKKQHHLYREAADALAKFEKDGSKELAKAVEGKRIKDFLVLRGHLLEALGRTQDTKQIDYLLEEATRSPHDEIRAAAGKALGEFTNAKLKDKRDVVKQLLRSWGSLQSDASRLQSNDPANPVDFQRDNAIRTLQAIRDKWIGTLSRLTGQSLTRYEDWQRWQNKNAKWTPPGYKK
ncbi:MAG: HEAT repeat domain-containing protein [bacterium]|nr:HEAT repeat domain-containing protein [bacterium]